MLITRLVRSQELQQHRMPLLRIAVCPHGMQMFSLGMLLRTCLPQ